MRSAPIGTKIEIPKNVWHELTIECKGDRIRASLNGKEALPELSDPSFANGKIGFWTKSDAVSQFRDLKLTYTPRTSLAEVLVRDIMNKYPRLKGLQICAPDPKTSELKVMASSNPAEIGLPAQKELRSVIDPANTLQDPRLFKAGEAPYARAGTNFFSGNSWGNYSATVVDPANDLDMWTLQEYAASPVAGADRWGTWWARVEVTGVTQCGQVQFAAKKSEVLEGAPAGVATIAVTNFTGMAGSVKFATSDGTAVAGLDYNARNGTLTFAPGQKTASFNIVIQDDGVVNSNRTVNLSLFNPVNLSLGSVTNSVLTIIDDEYVKPANIAGEFNFSTYVPTNYYWNSNSYFYSPYYVASEFE